VIAAVGRGYAALWTDLRRNRTDADLTDVKYLATEADHALSHLRQWMEPLSVTVGPRTEAPTPSNSCHRSGCKSQLASTHGLAIELTGNDSS
jgi:hypothetical protein